MKTDSYFEIGSTHEVCQDYAISGHINPKMAFAIITDGCTASHKECNEVDFGARVLAYAARDALFKLEVLLTGPWEDKEYFKKMVKLISQKTLEIVSPIKDQLRLHPMFADATLVICLNSVDKACSIIYGDGGVLVKHMDGTTTYDEIGYNSSAPYYLAYAFDKDRQNGYRISFGAAPVIHSRYLIPMDGAKLEDCNIIHNMAKEINENIYHFSSFVYNNVASISVTSDGIKSFQKSGTNGIEDIASLAMVHRFIGFKNTNGAFVQRRMKRLQQECKEEQISHYDDISISSIVV